MAAISIWEKQTIFAPQDVIIIGAGLMGMWSAIAMKAKYPSASISIVEKHPFPLGASTRNAGFACFGSVSELLYDEKINGTEQMLQIVEWRYLGIQKILQTFSSETIDYDACGGFECFSKSQYDTTQLPDQVHYLNKLLHPVIHTNAYHLANDQMQEQGLKNFDALVANTQEGGLHSGKLVLALQQKCSALGIRILYGVAYQNWEKIADKILIETNFGKFYSTHLLFCTNAFTNKIIPNWVQPARGQVLLTDPIEHLQLHGTFHFDEGFYYWRNLGNQLLIGGARNVNFEQEQTTELAITEDIQQTLEQFLYNHIDVPTPITIQQRWSGVMGFTPNKLPQIHSLNEQVHAVIACNGMGVALTPIMGEKVAQQIHLSF